jgi:hypothetical protein
MRPPDPTPGEKEYVMDEIELVWIADFPDETAEIELEIDVRNPDYRPQSEASSHPKIEADNPDYRPRSGASSRFLARAPIEAVCVGNAGGGSRGRERGNDEAQSDDLFERIRAMAEE